MSRPWYAHFPADYGRKTAHLTMVQDGAYRRLLDHYYATAKPLPKIAEQLHRICRAFSDDERSAVISVVAEFFTLGQDGYHNKRADEEIAEAQRLRAVKVQAGQAGGNAARGKSGRKPNGEKIADEIAPPIANAIAEPIANNSPSPSPSPSQKKEDDDDGRDELPASLDRVKAILLKICETLGVRYGSDPQQIVWLNVVTEMLRDGIPEQDIFRAADITRTKGMKNINYVRTVAISLATEKTHERSRAPVRESVATSWTRAAAELAAEFEAGNTPGNSGGAVSAGPQLLAPRHEAGGEENRSPSNVRRLNG